MCKDKALPWFPTVIWSWMHNEYFPVKTQFAVGSVVNTRSTLRISRILLLIRSVNQYSGSVILAPVSSELQRCSANSLEWIQVYVACTWGLKLWLKWKSNGQIKYEFFSCSHRPRAQKNPVINTGSICFFCSQSLMSFVFAVFGSHLELSNDLYYVERSQYSIWTRSWEQHVIHSPSHSLLSEGQISFPNLSLIGLTC